MNYNTFIQKNKKGLRTALYLGFFFTIGVGLGFESRLLNHSDILTLFLTFLIGFCFIFGLILVTNLIIRNHQKKIFSKINDASISIFNDKITFEYTQNDYYKASFTSLLQQGTWWFLIILSTLLLIGSIFISLFRGFKSANIFVIILALFYITYPFLGLRIRSNNLFNEQENCHGIQSIEIVDKLALKNIDSSGENIIKNAHHIFINKEFILIYNTPITFTILPRRIFRDENQFIMFAKIAITLVEGKV